VNTRTLAPALLLAASCAVPASKSPLAPASPAAEAQAAAANIAELAASEERAFGWLAAADPRLAARLGMEAPADVLNQIGTEAVLAEDASASIHDGALDLFGFRARALAVERAAKEAAAAPAALPGNAAAGAPMGRPLLERELLVRFIEEERARGTDEAALGAASGDLVRAMLSTWKAPSGDDAWRARDAWAAKHLLDIADSLRGAKAPAGPLDLDEALYPLERLLAPLQFPKASAALARVRTALDDARGIPALWSAESIARGAKTHLGTAIDVTTFRARLEPARANLRAKALALLAGAGEGRAALEAHARELLFVEGPCPAITASRIRSAAPPPERAAACGVLKALASDASTAPAVVALSDDVDLAVAAFDPSPPPRTGLLSHPDNDLVDTLRRSARQRPVVALGLAVAAVVLYDDPSVADARTRAWAQLGEAPLDVVAREVGAAPLP
jgi:hypothetical protein